MKRKRRIGSKSGSSLLTSGGNGVNKKYIIELCRQKAILMNDRGCEAFLVTSGAVASDPHKERDRNVRATIGQGRLIAQYITCMDFYGIEVAQLLVTDDDFLIRAGRTKKTLLGNFEIGALTVINANDGVDDEEMKALDMCADNDRTFKMVCELVGVDLAVIGFDKPGVLDEKGRVIHEVTLSDEEYVLSLAKGGNEDGYGECGAETKFSVLFDLARLGIKAILAPGKEINFILRAAEGEKNFGTIFLP